jgi:hypothetical protein
MPGDQSIAHSHPVQPIAEAQGNNNEVTFVYDVTELSQHKHELFRKTLQNTLNNLGNGMCRIS